MHGAHGHKAMKAAGLLALRIALAIVFITMGSSKIWGGHDMAVGMFNHIGLSGGGEFWAYFVGTLELVGGLMVLLGVFARYAAAWLSVILIVALLTVHLGGPLSSALLAVISLGGTLCILGSGAGKWRLVPLECHCGTCRRDESGAGGNCCGGGCGRCSGQGGCGSCGSENGCACGNK